MNTYARVYSMSSQPTLMGIIESAVHMDGNEIPIGERLTASFVETMVNIRVVSRELGCRWTYASPIGIVAMPCTFRSTDLTQADSI